MHRWRISAVRPCHDVHELGDHPALPCAVATVDRMLDAMGNVIAKDLLLDPPKGRTRRRNLCDDVDAIAVLIDHAREAANLSLDPFEASQARRLGLNLHD
jgi:hypothetical protein